MLCENSFEQLKLDSKILPAIPLSVNELSVVQPVGVGGGIRILPSTIIGTGGDLHVAGGRPIELSE